MNARTEILRLVDGETAIEGLDAIAQTVESSLWVMSRDRDLERQGAIRVTHADRCLGPG